MIIIKFDNGTFKIQSIKSVCGNIHERINKRSDIVMLRNFMENHPLKL
jgi:hypothetical protein